MAAALPAGSTLPTIEGAEFDYTAARWVLFRARGFWPLLRVPLAARTNTFLTHDHRISWTFDAPLEEVIPAIDALAGTPDYAPLSTAGDFALGWGPAGLTGGSRATDESAQDILNRIAATGS
jgi:hypothetical protein